MFDVAFSELVIIGVVALIVIGPERLPKVARTAGHLLGRLQRYVNDVKADINREMQLEELKKIQGDIASQAQGLEQSLSQQLQTVETELNQSIAPPADPEVPTVATLPASADPASVAAAVATGTAHEKPPA